MEQDGCKIATTKCGLFSVSPYYCCSKGGVSADGVCTNGIAEWMYTLNCCTYPDAMCSTESYLATWPGTRDIYLALLDVAAAGLSCLSVLRCACSHADMLCECRVLCL
jgi:hypothetical protein